ncbi:hypothetical protein HUG12_00055 [Halorarum salinum]|uniref:Uncharacterized protein n=1 Tax=Halorarum salinum TaxID=2743089 RepID=A0A7D5L7S1_9EURY|nr:hypothetical protein [Halobaculum salinum]QLG60226.1 hypothetical protein HUG12_00055 [Halobaculum salinum]
MKDAVLNAVDDSSPLLGGYLLERRGSDARRDGVVHEHVDGSPAVAHRSHGRVDRVAIGHVVADDERVAARLADAVGGFRRTVFVGTIGDHDAGPFSSERDGRRSADFGGTPRHQHDALRRVR